MTQLGATRSEKIPVSTPRHRAFTLGVALLTSVGGLVAACGSPPPELRVVLITLDTLRYDRFEGGGTLGIPMPRTRELAERGLVYRNSYAATSTTQPTHASLFTGLHPWEHGVPRNGVVLEPEIETIAERLQQRGFRTAAVVASFPLHRRFGFEQGFDVFEDEFSEGSRERWNQVDVPGERFYSTADVVTRLALDALDDLGGRKQFFWFHYFDAHQPYGDAPGGEPVSLVGLKNALRRGEPGTGERIERARQGYDQDVRYMDALLGTLFDRLDAEAQTVETHIVIVSDHGESFGEGGSLGHGERVTSEQIRVPLVIVSPRVEPGTRDEAVGSVDIAATLDALGGGDGRFGGGRDLTRDPERWAAESPVTGMRRTFAEPYQDIRTDGTIEVVDGLRFYLVADGREYVGDETQVEANDGDPVEGATRARLAALFATFRRTLEGGGEQQELLDRQTREALEALGYAR